MAETKSLFQLRLGEILQGPATTRQNQCMSCYSRADKLSAWGLRGWRLEAQRRFFTIFGAGSAEVRRMSGSVVCWLLAEYDDGPMSECHGFIVGKLLTLAYKSAQLSSKFELLFQRCLKLRVQEQLLALQRQYRSLRFYKSSQEVCSGCSNLAGITFCNQSLSDCFCACDGRDGQLNFAEHGCPSNEMVRVEELALSSGVGIHPNAEEGMAERSEEPHGRIDVSGLSVLDVLELCERDFVFFGGCTMTDRPDLPLSPETSW